MVICSSSLVSYFKFKNEELNTNIHRHLMLSYIYNCHIYNSGL